MQGDPRIIDLLNQVLRKELTGINQYFIHSRMCKNWGYAVLEKVHYDEAIEEMKHADLVIQRILFLEGVPNLADYDRILVGPTPREQLDNDLALEHAALAVLRPVSRFARGRRPRHPRPPGADHRRRGAPHRLDRGAASTRSPRSGTSSTWPSRSMPDRRDVGPSHEGASRTWRGHRDASQSVFGPGVTGGQGRRAFP